MGDAKSGNTMQTSNTSSTSGPNPFIADKLQSLIGGKNGAWDWIGNHFDAPGYFPNGTVAPQSAGTISANTTQFNRAAAMLNGPGNTTDAGRKFALDTLGGKYLDPNQNTAFQDYLTASFRPQAEQFRDILAPSIDSKFAGSGRTSGGAHFDTTMRGVQDLERSQSDAAAKAGLGLYQGERANQFQAAGLLPQFQNMDYQNIAAMQQAAAGNDAYSQRKLDDANQKYSYDTSGQLDWYNRLSQTLQGMYPGGQTQGNSSSSGMMQQPGGGVGSFLGPAMSIAGMALPFLSDRRDKTDIEELGIDPLTGLKTYSYRYKGEPKNQPKIVGPMAQDIEKVRPDLVREIGGHKVVGLM